LLHHRHLVLSDYRKLRVKLAQEPQNLQIKFSIESTEGIHYKWEKL